MSGISKQYDESWFWVGLKFGTGFTLGALVAGLVIGAAGLALWGHLITATAKDAAVTPNSLPSLRLPAIPTPRTVHVPPGSREDCLNASHGVADAHYQRCRNGYDTTVTD